MPPLGVSSSQVDVEFAHARILHQEPCFESVEPCLHLAELPRDPLPLLFGLVLAPAAHDERVLAILHDCLQSLGEQLPLAMDPSAATGEREPWSRRLRP